MARHRRPAYAINLEAVDLTSPALGDVLPRYRELPIVRAVRQPLSWGKDPLQRLGARPDFLADSAWWRGFEQVAEQRLVWDLLLATSNSRSHPS